MSDPEIVKSAKAMLERVERSGGKVREPLIWRPGLSAKEVSEIESQIGTELAPGLKAFIRTVGELSFLWQLDENKIPEEFEYIGYGGVSSWSPRRIVEQYKLFDGAWSDWDPSVKKIGFRNLSDLSLIYVSFDGTHYCEDDNSKAVVILAPGILHTKKVFSSSSHFFDFVERVGFLSLESFQLRELIEDPGVDEPKIDEEYVEDWCRYLRSL